MENPAKERLRALRFVLFGIAIGAVPGLIHVDQMRRQAAAQIAEAAKLSDEARKQVTDALGFVQEAKRQIEASRTDCTRLLAGDGAETVIVTQNHPYAGWQQKIQGITLMVPQPDYPVVVSPILIIKGKVAPAALDGISGAVYTHLWPDGRTDGWRAVNATGQGGAQ